MTLQDVLTIIWRRRWIVLFVTAIGGAAAWFVGGSIEPSVTTQTGEATLTLAAGEEFRSVELYTYIATETSEISSVVEASFGGDIPGGVDIVSVSAVGALRILAFGQPDEETARTVVGLYAEEISSYGSSRRIIDRDERLGRLDELEAELRVQVETLDRQLDAIEAALPEAQQGGRGRGDQLKETELAAASNALAAVLGERAELNAGTDEDLMPFEPLGIITVSEESTGADPLGQTGRMVLGVGLGFVLGTVLAFGLHRFDARLFTRRDAEAAYSLPVLAEIPKISWRRRRGQRIITRDRPRDKSAEAYRVLRSAIARARAVQLAEPDGPPTEEGSVILVTSASAAVGKTTTAANLAVAATDAGSSVLLVSADLRTPTAFAYFDVDPSLPGIADAVQAGRQGETISLSEYMVGTNVPGVSFLPHGSPVVSPGETLADARPLIEAARTQFDLVILDTSPMLAGNDVDELLPTSDLVLQVARAGRTTIDEGMWTDETIQRRDMVTCGLVLIGARSDLERRSTSRRSGWRPMLGGFFGRVFGQTGKIAWGSKANPSKQTLPPIDPTFGTSHEERFSATIDIEAAALAHGTGADSDHTMTTTLPAAAMEQDARSAVDGPGHQASTNGSGSDGPGSSEATEEAAPIEDSSTQDGGSKSKSKKKARKGAGSQAKAAATSAAEDDRSQKPGEPADAPDAADAAGAGSDAPDAADAAGAGSDAADPAPDEVELADSSGVSITDHADAGTTDDANVTREIANLATSGEPLEFSDLLDADDELETAPGKEKTS